jgi:hypothetical protein
MKLQLRKILGYQCEGVGYSGRLGSLKQFLGIWNKAKDTTCSNNSSQPGVT